MAKVDIVAIAEDDTVLLFNVIGIKTYTIKERLALEKKIAELAIEKCKIIYLTEKLYELIPEVIEKYELESYPIIIPLPLKETKESVGVKQIKKNVEKAIGFDILWGD